MNQYPQCQIHLYSQLQFIEFTQENCRLICGSCYHNLNEKTNSKIIDLFQIKQNPLLLNDLFPESFRDFNEMFNILKDIEIYNNTQIGVMKNLIQILNQMILDINQQQEKFKKLIEDIKIKLAKLINVEKLQGLINSIWNEKTNFSDNMKQQFEMQFLDYLMKTQNIQQDTTTDLQNERQSILKFYEEKKLSDPLAEFENQISNIKKQIKQVDILTFRSILLEKDFIMSTLSQVSKKYNNKFIQKNLIYKGEDIKYLKKELYQITQHQKKPLVIFQSKKQQNLVFSFYTPYGCQMDQFTLENTAFLFQYNNNIYFPIRVQITKNHEQKISKIGIVTKAGARLLLDYNKEYCGFQTAESEIILDNFWIYELQIN